ncbi:MAG: hypothetical protein ACLQM6_08235 [Acidobacteriaceae bacterium]
MGKQPIWSCIGHALRRRVHTALLRDDAMLHAVVELGAAVDGNRFSAAGMDGCDKFVRIPLHYLDFSASSPHPL